MSTAKSKNPSSKKRIALIIAAVILVVGIGIWFVLKPTAAKITYQAVKVTKGDLAVSILATGVVQPENRVDVKPPIAGRAERVLVDAGARVRKGQVLVWMSSTERAALLDAAQARGPEELKHWEELYKPTPIVAPITGMIIARNIEPGQTFATTDAILSMSDRLTVQAQVDETDIAQIKIKQAATVVLDAYPGSSIAATVDKIAFDAKTVNNVTTYVATVVPEQIPPTMRSGMTANVTFQLEAKKDVLIVPADTIRTLDGKPYILVQKGDGREKPENRTIQMGLTDGKRVEIVSGLTEGETVLAAQYKPGSGAAQAGSPFSPMGNSRKGATSKRPGGGGPP